jgi:hypothetical protein
MSSKEDTKERDQVQSSLSRIGMLFALGKRSEDIYDNQHGLFTDYLCVPELSTHDMEICYD